MPCVGLTGITFLLGPISPLAIIGVRFFYSSLVCLKLQFLPPGVSSFSSLQILEVVRGLLSHFGSCLQPTSDRACCFSDEGHIWPLKDFWGFEVVSLMYPWVEIIDETLKVNLGCEGYGYWVSFQNGTRKWECFLLTLGILKVWFFFWKIIKKRYAYLHMSMALVH